MPDAAGHFKGHGWSRARERGWLRALGRRHYCNNKVTTPVEERCYQHPDSQQIHPYTRMC